MCILKWILCRNNDFVVKEKCACAEWGYRIQTAASWYSGSALLVISAEWQGTTRRRYQATISGRRAPQRQRERRERKDLAATGVFGACMGQGGRERERERVREWQRQEGSACVGIQDNRCCLLARKHACLALATESGNTGLTLPPV